MGLGDHVRVEEDGEFINLEEQIMFEMLKSSSHLAKHLNKFNVSHTHDYTSFFFHPKPSLHKHQKVLS